MIGHRVTSPMLLGVKTEGQLGGRDELMQAFEIYQNTVIRPYQEHILKTLSKIMEINGINLPISFVQNSPITSKFSIEDMKEVMTANEIRHELGLKPLEEEEDFKEEDKYSLEKDCDCEKQKDQKKCDKSCYSKTELDSWLEDVGESKDLYKDFELVSSEKTGKEDPDFDFEKELNDNATKKQLFYRTGEPQKDRKSKQDGGNKTAENFYRVRYSYEEDPFLTRKSGGGPRTFCQKMLAANKLYRKEDIVKGKLGQSRSLSKIKANPGWGPGGSDKYDIWLWKGGGNCHHYWLRHVYRQKIEEGKIPISEMDEIGIVKARGEGFYPEANDDKVSKPPKRLPKKGFIKKR